MIDDKMRDDYNEYLEQHVKNVKLAFEWLCDNLPELLEGYDSDYIGNIISKHDASKWDDEEYYAYCEYFYGEKSQEGKEAVDSAWLHHQHYNSHHWQHWVLREDGGYVKALEMPYECLLEMICDHWSFSWAEGNLYEIFDWYAKNKHLMLLQATTRSKYEAILEKMKLKLDQIQNSGSRFMKIAITEAKCGINNHEGGPFGAVIVKDGVIVATGHNSVVANNDPTAHGEMVAIRNACERLGTFDLSGCELYTTHFPCPMCACAIRWANIKKVYYGCDVNDTASIGFRDKEFYEEMSTEYIQLERDSCVELSNQYKCMQHTMY